MIILVEVLWVPSPNFSPYLEKKIAKITTRNYILAVVVLILANIMQKKVL